MERPIMYRRIDHVTRTRSHRGFRLKYTKRFSVYKLRGKLMCLLRMLNTWRRSYSRTLRSLRKSSRRWRSKHAEVAEFPRYGVDRGEGEGRLRSFRRSNSFYAEAIADCLDFIKRSYVSIDAAPGQPRPIEFRDRSG